MSVEVGRREVVEIDGIEHFVGLVQINGEWQASYMPKSTFRYKDGDNFHIIGVTFRILKAGMSQFMPRMVLLRLERPNEEVTDGSAAE